MEGGGVWSVKGRECEKGGTAVFHFPCSVKKNYCKCCP